MSDEKKLTTEDAKRVLEEQNVADTVACENAVRAALKEFGCNLQWAELRLNGSQVKGEIQVVKV